MKDFVTSWGFILLAAAGDSFAAYVAKNRFNELGEIDFSSAGGFLDYFLVFIRAPLVLPAALGFALAPVLWFLALNKIELSVAYPALVAVHLLLVVFLGVAFLGEGLTVNKIIATLLVLISVVLVYK